MKKLVVIFAVLLAFSSCESDLSSSEAISPGSGQGGSLARFGISKNYMFAVNGSSLKVFDINTPSDPNLISTTDLGVYVETIFVRDDSTMFIGSTQGMFIYDISDVPTIRQLSRYSHVTSCDPVVANDKYAYVTLRSTDDSRACNRGVNQLDIIDISDLSYPQLVNNVSMDFPIGLGLYGDTLLVCDNGVKVFSIVDPLNPYYITTNSNIDAVDIIPYGKQMIISTNTGIEQYEYFKGKLKLLSKI